MYFWTGQGSPLSSVVDDGGVQRRVTLWIHRVHQSVQLHGGTKNKPTFQWRRSVMVPGHWGHLSPSVNPPLFPSLSWTLHVGGLGRARSPVAKHFDAIYTVKQRYRIHIDV